MCSDCFEDYGHCGHPEAERQNELARNVCQDDCSHCHTIGCEQRRCFAGIADLINTGYQDERTKCLCDCDVKLSFGKCKDESEHTGLQEIIEKLEYMYRQIKRNPLYSDDNYAVVVSKRIKQDVFFDIGCVVLCDDVLPIIVDNISTEIDLQDGGYSSDIWIVRN